MKTIRTDGVLVLVLLISKFSLCSGLMLLSCSRNANADFDTGAALSQCTVGGTCTYDGVSFAPYKPSRITTRVGTKDLPLPVGFTAITQSVCEELGRDSNHSRIRCGVIQAIAISNSDPEFNTCLAEAKEAVRHKSALVITGEAINAIPVGRKTYFTEVNLVPLIIKISHCRAP